MTRLASPTPASSVSMPRILPSSFSIASTSNSSSSMLEPLQPPLSEVRSSRRRWKHSTTTTTFSQHHQFIFHSDFFPLQHIPFILNTTSCPPRKPSSILPSFHISNPASRRKPRSGILSARLSNASTEPLLWLRVSLLACIRRGVPPVSRLQPSACSQDGEAGGPRSLLRFSHTGSSIQANSAAPCLRLFILQMVHWSPRLKPLFENKRP